MVGRPEPSPGLLRRLDAWGRAALPATGVFFDRQDPAALEDAITRFEKAEFQFHPAALRASAERFAPARFDRALDAEIAACLGGPNP